MEDDEITEGFNIFTKDIVKTHANCHISSNIRNYLKDFKHRKTHVDTRTKRRKILNILFVCVTLFKVTPDLFNYYSIV